MESHGTSRTNRGSKIIRRLVEAPIFLYFFTFTISESVYSNLVLYKLCRLKYNDTICTLLISSGDNTTLNLEEELQPQAAMINMSKSLIEGIFPAAISLFLGPWSDSNGRKPLIIASLIGHLFYFIIILGFTLLEKFNPWYLLIASVPYSLSGATSSIITGSFCYISDVTDNDNRSFRMGLLEGAILFGILIASLSTAYIYKLLGYTGTFGVCIILTILTIISAAVLEESLHDTNQKGASLFDKKLVVEMFRTCFKRRSQYRRSIMLCIMFACTCGILVMQGDSAVGYLFTREKLKWTLDNYMIYGAFSIASTIVGVLTVALILQKYLHMSDTVISMLSYISAAVKAIIFVFATKSWHMYLAAGVSCLRAVSGPINRSIMTKIVPTEDAGKVLSFTSSLEVIIPLASAPIYSLLYEKTLTFFPGAYNILTAGLFILSFLSILIVHTILKRYPSNDYAEFSVNQHNETGTSESLD